VAESRLTVVLPRWKLFARRRLGFVIFTLAGMTLLFGLAGFSWQYYDTRHPDNDATLPVFRAVQLFLLNSGAEDDDQHPNNWMLAVARISAASFLLVVSATAIVSVLDEVRRLPRLMRQRDHVVICGLGQIGLQLLQDLHAQGRGKQIVAIDNSPDNIWLDKVRGIGISVVLGDATRSEVLDDARAQFAREIFVVTGDDGVNLEVVTELSELLTSAAGGKTLPTKTIELYVHIGDTNQATSLQPNTPLLHSTQGLRVHVFNLPRDSATEVVTRQVPLYAPRGPDEVAHFVIIGFGSMGQVLAVQLAQLAHYANRQRCRMTIADRDINTSARAFLARHPRFTSWTKDTPGVQYFASEADQWSFNSLPLPADIAVPHDEAIQYVCNAEFVELPGGHSDESFARRLAQSFEKQATATPRVTVRPIFFVCGQQDRDNVDVAVQLREQLVNAEVFDRPDRANAPIFVWIPRQPAVAHTLRHDGRFIPFGLCESSARYREITSPRRDSLGKTIHDSYESQQVALGNKSCGTPWRDLREQFRDSSRAAADHALVKLSVLHLRLCEPSAPRPDSPPLVAEGSDDELLLAEIEHWRWVAERLLAGWRYAPSGPDPEEIAQQKKRKLNGTIVPWTKLNNGEKEKDIHLVRVVLRACQVESGTESSPVVTRSESIEVALIESQQKSTAPS